VETTGGLSLSDAPDLDQFVEPGRWNRVWRRTQVVDRGPPKFFFRLGQRWTFAAGLGGEDGSEVGF
jgi:hypothetical protein